jgi:hypothetical protein
MNHGKQVNGICKSSGKLHIKCIQYYFKEKEGLLLMLQNPLIYLFIFLERFKIHLNLANVVRLFKGIVKTSKLIDNLPAIQIRVFTSS